MSILKWKDFDDMMSIRDEVDRLFDSGLDAYRRRDWAEAGRLFDELVWRSPNYRRGRKYAAQLLAKAQRREERAQRNGQVDWRWAAAVVLVLIGAGIVGPFAFGWISGRDRMAAMFQAATPTPRMPPEVTHILAPTTAPTSTPRPTSRSTNTPAPTSTPTPVPTLAPRVQYAPPPAPAPQLLGPEYGQYSNPIVFSWIGPQNQSYQVTLQHMDEEYVHYSGLIDGFSWTFDIPGTEWGNWQWYVTSSEGINSTVWSFTFNPLPPISAGE